MHHMYSVGLDLLKQNFSVLRFIIIGVFNLNNILLKNFYLLSLLLTKKSLSSNSRGINEIIFGSLLGDGFLELPRREELLMLDLNWLCQLNKKSIFIVFFLNLVNFILSTVIYIVIKINEQVKLIPV